MYSLGLDSPAAVDHLHRSLALIVHLELPQTHAWVHRSPAASSEITTTDGAYPDAPVSVEQSLRSAVTAALESASQIRYLIESEAFAPAPFRAALRTILMSSGRLGYVALPMAREERRRHAEHVLGIEARSLVFAIKDIDQITNLVGLRWTPDEVNELRRKAATISTDQIPGDRTLIRTAAELIGEHVHAADPTISATTLRDHLAWAWHTSSGSAHGFAWQSLASGDFVTDLGDVLSAFHFTLDAAQEMWVHPENLADAP